MTTGPTRRTEFDVIIVEGVRPHWVQRTVARVLYAPDWPTAASMFHEALLAEDEE